MFLDNGKTGLSDKGLPRYAGKDKGTLVAYYTGVVGKITDEGKIPRPPAESRHAYKMAFFMLTWYFCVCNLLN